MFAVRANIPGMSFEYEDLYANEENDKCDGEENTTLSPEKWIKWTNPIFKETENNAFASINGNIVNALYATEVAADLKKIMPFVWSAIMSLHFEIGS